MLKTVETLSGCQLLRERLLKFKICTSQKKTVVDNE